MNIQEAKEQIKQAVSVYLMKDAYGNYRIPIQRQRPVFLIGAPGIGKTAIVDQIAKELNIGLISYSMTHHTRQSALGLPFIAQKTYKEKTFDISEYTMSEIIASIYEVMEASGKEEGILFLDEINCVSETLSPSMLQFLQYKTFGRHQVPDGWIIVTAGNPQEFNRSVREFDVVTLDRLKVMEVEPSYPIWRNYALNQNLHKAILTYLDIKKQDFYLIESTVDGKSYVTARGWEDLSDAIYLYEEAGFSVDETLIGQYLRNKRIAREFAAYYDLYMKYKQDYRVQEILSGDADRQIKDRAKEAAFDERLSLMGLLLDALQHDIRENVELEDCMRRLTPVLRDIKEQCVGSKAENSASLEEVLQAPAAHAKEVMEQQQAAHALSVEDKNGLQFIISMLTKSIHEMKRRGITDKSEGFEWIKGQFDGKVAQMQQQTTQVSEKLHHAFAFVEQIFGDGNEMLVLVTELTVNYNSAMFIARKGCEDYYRYNKKFMLHERNQELMEALEKLEQSKHE